MVDPSAEFRHEPGPEPNWQENYMFSSLARVTVRFTVTDEQVL